MEGAWLDVSTSAEGNGDGGILIFGTLSRREPRSRTMQFSEGDRSGWDPGVAWASRRAMPTD